MPVTKQIFTEELVVIATATNIELRSFQVTITSTFLVANVIMQFPNVKVNIYNKDQFHAIDTTL